MEKKSVHELVMGNRSYRRFDASMRVEIKTLKGLVDLARNTASAGNLQPLKYILSASEEKNREIFSCLAWAAYLPKWKGPEPGERPSGYIVIMGDKNITENFRCDHGIAAQTILLGAREQGLGGCIFAAINHKKIRQYLSISPSHEVLLVIALGKPVENVVLEQVGEDGNIRYWRDRESVHHVPKRKLEEIIVAAH
ncbi:Nitroreductase [Desulfocicer vacuolatum DSM 3385]|uniref:Nitroreductase n=1 Tax=Desulfocicer vacuolatum DSM 3385 TaxID=1121400 RepID=A0A1W2CRN8_9BACT|nr:nitroreductase family protein [Desulfocicer vacuolatum]SMC87552.1 Nitroreductase [Desulfocicer vacuolatum DSM 3385]